ncbi:MAG: hypothetical protein K6B52_00055 [Clostridiales bacterium]|nr:hypothetical protein [Clostridiales bacterium]
MKVLCIAETVYQLINAVNLVVNDPEMSKAEVDLFVRKGHFANEDVYLERIIKERIFSAVNRYSFKDYSKFNFINHLRHVSDILFASRIIGRACSIRFRPRKYDVILTPNGCQFFKYSVLCCKKAVVYCYEDGALSYGNVNWIEREVSPLSKKILKITGQYKKLLPERVYLYNPSFFMKSWETDVCKLPPMKDAVKSDLMHRIFGKPECDYAGVKTVFLSQPAPVSEKVTQRIAKGINVQFISRLHPRNSQNLCIKGIIDHSSSLWEMICAEYITDSHILIGACSSAQTSPKWLFGKEPYLIFTYPLYEDIEHRFIKVSEEIVTKTRIMYQNPDKIAVVYSVDELNECIQKFLSAP